MSPVGNAPDSLPAEADRPDVFKGFEGQRTPTHVDYVSALLHGLIVVDANVLLDLYRYNDSGRLSLLATFRAFGHRLWIPHQVLHEFWNNREEVLGDPQGAKGVVTSLDKAEATAVQSINSWAKLSAQPDYIRDEVSSYIQSGFEEAREQISARSDGTYKDWLKDTNEDPVLRELERLLQGKIGAPPTDAELAICVEEALRRIEAKEPPGYKDRHKSDPKAAGDYLIWQQIMTEASNRDSDVLFVTRDLKEDWVRRKDDELSGPRPELVQEMLAKTGRRFFLRSPAGVLELARNNMSVEVSDESLADARRLNEAAQPVHSIISAYHWIRQSSGWDVASAENLLDALTVARSPLATVLTRLATTGEVVDQQMASELGFSHFGQVRTDLERTIDALQDERLISPTATAPLLPVMRRTEGGTVDVQGYRLSEEVQNLFHAILEGSEDLYMWRYLDDDRLAEEFPHHHSGPRDLSFGV
ncbi:PIN domain-containing protein [Arthrobacter sp. Helios]|uniref:PIN domain-containing protein n=1 Tax=Arthrobacter sp. Helios TaxID=2828862 RepID=UPI00205A1E97|nr:PIN domain-containing protein [Arthrobacter sp. Helios]UPO78899.1 PIN domain-containing protein [Arthrobacter sp. Helios]